MNVFTYTNKNGTQYTLCAKVVALRSKRQQQIYWFARSSSPRLNPTLCVSELPTGYVVWENPKSGMPLLRKGVL